jgi:predicted transcriptional regulator
MGLKAKISNMDQAALFQLVRVANRTPFRLKWKAHGIAAAASTKQALNKIATRGLIERKKVHVAPAGKIFYFRSRTDDTGAAHFRCWPV